MTVSKHEDTAWYMRRDQMRSTTHNYLASLVPQRQTNQALNYDKPRITGPFSIDPTTALFCLLGFILAWASSPPFNSEHWVIAASTDMWPGCELPGQADMIHKCKTHSCDCWKEARPFLT
ncbi:hypothetical protein CEXT_273361 [Caerostris extrusa]|uniref:Uncharacterized protein n=1 Tax=Caerostris extrusa TaxID=172846 RepID=A0AAV4RWU7_CAEEX|nr:hypothetical protein CEXT_273361 [Caerostris extrusa]